MVEEIQSECISDNIIGNEVSADYFKKKKSFQKLFDTRNDSFCFLSFLGFFFFLSDFVHELHRMWFNFPLLIVWFCS